MIRTTCPYCGVGCGVAVTNGVPKGDTRHPANFGRLCSKGAALKDTLELPDRLTTPILFGREAGWDEALNHIAREFIRIRAQHGPDAIAFYVSGQFLTEDYYVANKLMKGFISSGNIDTNSRLCMASSVAGHVRAFGEDVVPGCYDDLEEADLVVAVGSNMAWAHPVLYQRLMAAREKRGTKIVNIDPRRTATSETSDLHLALTSGSDVLLFNGLLAYLADNNHLDRDWIGTHVSGADEAIEKARATAPSPAFVASLADLSVEDVVRFYEMFAATERVVTLYSQGVNQSRSGTDKVNAILNCHLATGRIGRAGMGPFSLTGQPNAMGGREVGGLANQLAAHMMFTDEAIDRVGRFWNAPGIAKKPGLKAVDLFEAIGKGDVKAVWIAATNPADSMPRARQIREALAKCELVIVADAWPTDTTKLAHIVLPAATWAEKDGTVTNSERRISRQRGFRSAPGAARPDWWMYAEVGKRMGWTDAFTYAGPAEIFREHAALSAFENSGGRAFDIGALTDLSDANYAELAPVQWPCPKPGTGVAGPRLFARGGFSTPDGRARMLALDCAAEGEKESDLLTLNTGRTRDQWHTMTRTGRVAHLMTHSSAPRLHLHPKDAARHGLKDGALVRVENAFAKAALPIQIDDAQRPGDAFIPMHWTDQFSSFGPVGALVHAKTDPVSGQPDLKASRVRVSALSETWHGAVLRQAAEEISLGDSVYWAKTPAGNHTAFEMTGWTPLADVIDSESVLRKLLQIPADAEIVSYSDPKRAVFRYAGLINGKLEACAFFAPPGVNLPGVEQAKRLMGTQLSAENRLSLLAGIDAGPSQSGGKIVCSCFSVGEEAIKDAIRENQCRTPADIGSALHAGTNCGSCIPELKKLLAEGAQALEVV